MNNRVYYALAVLLLLIAAVPRIIDLDTFPVGFSQDEITTIALIDDEIGYGNIRVFYDASLGDPNSQQGQEGLYPMVLALAALLFGEGTFGLRALSLLVNMVTIAILYTLGVRLFGRLAGLLTAGVYTVLFWTILLSRLVLVETVLPLIVAAILLALARALPVYARTRDETHNTIDFATLGVLIALSLYLHPTSLFIVLLSMAFVIYILISHRPISLRQLSYIGFAILMMLIVAMPYFLSTLRLPQLGANGRIVGDYDKISLTILNTINSLFWQGDSNPLYNLPQRPLFDGISACLMIVGLVICLKNWRSTRHMLLLLALFILSPPIILGGNAPSFLNLTVALPLIVLLFGLGAARLIQRTPKAWRWLSVLGVILLLGANLAWTSYDLFSRWGQLDAVYEAYHGDVGRVAHYLDTSADTIPTIICDPTWQQRRAPNAAFNQVDLIYLHMNHDSALLREVDCRQAFVFADAGLHQQVVIAAPMYRNELSPIVADWLALGTPLPDMPDDMVIDMRVRRPLEDLLGVYTTTSPASYATDNDISERIPVAPPIRFGGNITWLGYADDPFSEYYPGETVFVTTYWRVEGVIPSDLTVFTHILSDPVFPAAQVDTLLANPRQLGERDVYLHDVGIPLAETIQSGRYIISVGAYQQTSSERLPVFIDSQRTQGNRIFLYSIVIE